MGPHTLRAPASIAVLAGAAVVLGCGGTDRAGADRATVARTAASTSSGTTTAPAAVPGARCSRRATPAQTEGPYFKAGSPQRASLLEPGLGGTRLVLTGRVLTTRCRPLVGARLDFWQANARGVYDNSGYRLRGHQATDANGRFQLTTIVPGEYAGRTEHIHVKVTPRGGSALTTQLYFPGVARNEEDGIFDSRLLMRVRDTAAGRRATFDFAVRS
jgi:protocatechuate 3,4-dioxygenase beta subunit